MRHYTQYDRIRKDILLAPKVLLAPKDTTNYLVARPPAVHRQGYRCATSAYQHHLRIHRQAIWYEHHLHIHRQAMKTEMLLVPKQRKAKEKEMRRREERDEAEAEARRHP